MLKYKRYREEEQTSEGIFKDTQEQVADDLKALSKLSMADYDEEDDPELNGEFLTKGLSDAEQYESDELPMSESQKNKILKKAFREAFMLKPVVKQYFADTGKDEETFDFDEFLDKYIPDNHQFKKYPAQLEQALNKYFPDMKVNRLAKAGKYGKKDEPLYSVNSNFQISDEAKAFADMYADASENVLENAAETCEEKYDSIYDTARSIIMGRATLPHAFICGDAGVGKCLKNNTPLSIRLSDEVADELELWLKSHHE